MKAIFIDVKNRTVSYIEIEKGLDAIYKVLECELFTVPLTYDNNDGLLVDDEGIINQHDYGFLYTDFPYQPLYGHGLIMGADDEGESDNVKSSLEKIKSKVRFIKFQH